MTIRLFNDVQQWPDDDGVSLASGKIYFYEAGTTTLKDTYTSKSLGTAQANPVILDADGRPANPIWLSGEYKYKVTNSVGVTIGIVIDNLNAETASDTVETGILVTNGSFETDSDGDGQPDNWTITALVNATIAVDTTDSAHGKNSLKFLSGGSGAGTAASELFDVLKGEVVTVEFTYKASSATVKTLVHIYTYDKDDGLVAQLEAYTEASSNPASYETHAGAVTIDPTAVRAKVVITGIESTGTITAGTTTHFDYIKVNRKLISDVEGDVEGNIIDSSGNEVVISAEVSSAVNEVTVTNASTGNSAEITGTGETNAGLEINTSGTGDLDLTTGGNGDVNLSSGGTGDVNVRATPIYGLVVLDTPELLIDDATPPTTATNHDSATLNTAGATKAILNVILKDITANSVYFSSATFTLHEKYEKAQSLGDYCFNEFTVNLDGNNDFWYLAINAGTSEFKVYLVGYYV